MSSKLTLETFMELWRKELLPSIHKEIHEELRPILQETNEVKNECNEI